MVQQATGGILITVKTSYISSRNLGQWALHSLVEGKCWGDGNKLFMIYVQ